MKRLAFLLILPLAFACKTQKDAVADTPSNDGSVVITSTTTTTTTSNSTTSTDSNTKPQKPYRVKAKLGNSGIKTDTYYINSVRIEGNLLLMDIEYSGGCAEHKFEFIGSPAISKSLPPQRHVKLMHDNGDDMCESMVNRSIEIDISELASSQTSGSEIILNLEGHDAPLKYIFP